MKIKQFLLCFGLFAFLFFSCNLLVDVGSSGGDNGGGSGGGSTGTTNPPTNVTSRKFWAQNIETNVYYQLDAELLAENENCKVWAEKGSGVTAATANSMANAYKNEILPKMLNTFGIKADIKEDGQVVAHNTMELADYYGDEDGKLCILLLDIKDGYKPGTSWVAGYFSAIDFFPTSRYKNSNECDMIYIDTYPSKPGTTDSNATFAHEMQHMMNFVTSILYRLEGNYIHGMDTWIDEGLATQAEWLIKGSHPADRWLWYNQDRSGLIKKGNNFFVWGNRENEDPEAVMDDYATAYLFFQWLRLQAGKNDIYYDIITSKNYDYKAVTSAANKYMTGKNYSDWGTLLKTWLAANYINAPSGPYGYRNDEVLKNVNAHTAPNGVTNISLAPGEGVYSLTNNFTLPAGSNQNIRYAGLSGNDLSDTATFSGGALLTYNVNTNTNGGTESGTTTGVAAYANADLNASGRSAAEQSLSGPFVIGAWDMLRRNGFERTPSLELPKPTKGITILE